MEARKLIFVNISNVTVNNFLILNWCVKLSVYDTYPIILVIPRVLEDDYSQKWGGLLTRCKELHINEFQNLRYAALELKVDNVKFPLSQCVEASMFIASKGNLYRKLGRLNESDGLLKDLYKRPCLASYQGYAFCIASGV